MHQNGDMDVDCIKSVTTASLSKTCQPTDVLTKVALPIEQPMLVQASPKRSPKRRTLHQNDTQNGATQEGPNRSSVQK